MSHPTTKQVGDYNEADHDDYKAFHLPGQTLVYGINGVSHAKIANVLGFRSPVPALTWLDTEGMWIFIARGVWTRSHSGFVSALPPKVRPQSHSSSF